MRTGRSFPQYPLQERQIDCHGMPVASSFVFADTTPLQVSVSQHADHVAGHWILAALAKVSRRERGVMVIQLQETDPVAESQPHR